MSLSNVVVAEQFPFSIPSRIWISSNVGGANSIEQQEQQEQQQQDEEDAYLGQSEITNLHPNICSYSSVCSSANPFSEGTFWMARFARLL